MSSQTWLQLSTQYPLKSVMVMLAVLSHKTIRTLLAIFIMAIPPGYVSSETPNPTPMVTEFWLLWVSLAFGVFGMGIFLWITNADHPS